MRNAIRHGAPRGPGADLRRHLSADPHRRGRGAAPDPRRGDLGHQPPARAGATQPGVRAPGRQCKWQLVHGFTTGAGAPATGRAGARPHRASPSPLRPPPTPRTRPPPPRARDRRRPDRRAEGARRLGHRQRASDPDRHQRDRRRLPHRSAHGPPGGGRGPGGPGLDGTSHEPQPRWPRAGGRRSRAPHHGQSTRLDRTARRPAALVRPRGRRRRHH